jgi:hypothetical protein
MSSNAQANLIYGFPISQEVWNAKHDEIDRLCNVDEAPFLVFHGSIDPDVFIAIHKIEVWDCEHPKKIQPADLLFTIGWDQKLEDIMKKLNHPKTSCGWYLTTTYS